MEAVKPDYSGPNVTGVVPALLGSRPVSWLPEPVAGARSTVLLVLDGLGWEAFSTHPERLPELGGLHRRTRSPPWCRRPRPPPSRRSPPGCRPSRHGITGFRIRQERSVLNAIRWQLADGSRPPDPAHLQKHPVFGGRAVPVVTKSMFRTTGFTAVHLRGVDFHGWQTTSVLVEHVRAAGRRGRAVRVRVLPGRRRGRARVRARTRRTTRRSSPPPTGSSARCSTCCRPTPRCWSRPTTGRSRSDRTAGSGCNRSHPMVDDLRGRRPVPVPARAARGRGRPVRGRVGAPRRRRVGVPARTAARRGVARARPGVGHVPARRRRRARGRGPASASSIRRCPTRRSSSPPTDRSPRRRCWCRWSPPAAARANVGELHPCDSSTALWRGLWTRERTSGSNVGQVVRAPPSPHRVLDARRCGPHPGGGRDGGGRRPTRRRHHRPREHVRRPRLLPRGAGGRPHAGDRHRGLHGHDQPARPAAARPARHLPPHVAGGIDAGLPQPHQGVVARVPRRVLPEAAGRLRAARAAPRGPRRHDRLPRRRGLAGDPAGRLPARPASTSTASSRSSGATRSSSSCRTTACPSSCR